MQALDFLNKNKVFYLATSENNQPHIRPIGFVMKYNDKLTFCTSNNKKMCKQMAENPLIEICCMDSEYNTLRLCGKVVFCTSPETQTKALEVMPSLKQLYSVGDGKFEIFYLDDAKAICQAINGETQILEI